MDVQLSDQGDASNSKLTSNGVFTVKSMYLDLINSGPIPRLLHIWKVKVPLRIKIFMWFVHKQVILTKDNLLKRHWVGSSRCCFYDNNETIQHLFIDCPLAKLLWRTIHMAFNIVPAVSIAALFGAWLAGMEHNTAARIRIGICALLWAIWSCKNDMIFNKQQFSTFLQVIFRATAWIRKWSLLTPMDFREPLITVCNQWQMVAWAIFNRFGWRSLNRIGI